MTFSITDLFFHLDTHLNTLAALIGPWAYVLLFIIIFCESGLVLTPFLPGDSLLFATGSLAATGAFEVEILAVTLSCAAIMGNFVNYALGHKLGKVLFPPEKESHSRYRKYMVQTQAFYQRHGVKTIILARFIPIVRTYAPFVAGLAKMNFYVFAVYNVISAIGWVCLLLYASFYFGQMSIVKENFSLVVFAIIIISILPGVIEIMRQRFFVQSQK